MILRSTPRVTLLALAGRRPWSRSFSTEPRPPPPVSSIPDPTFLEPLSAAFLSLPPAWAVSYAAAIPLLTVVYRTCTTLPVVLWQRRRTHRFATLVLPRLRRDQARLALETRDECRRAGKSYPEYQHAKKLAYALATEFKCSPRVTLVLPPVVHIPIFVLATLTLRDACTRSVATLAVDPSSDLLAASSSWLSPTALEHLHALASTPVLWCPSLVLPDPTMLLPLAVGVASLLNVEVSARNRLHQTEAAQQTLDHPATPTTTTPTPTSQTVTASEKRRIVARKARQGELVRVRGYSSSSSSSPSTRTPTPPESTTKPNTARIVTNVLRFASVAFIPVAGLAPSAVCLYWIASNVFTLVQNATFAAIDRKRERSKRVGMILQGRGV
ncbi:hypothetical protein JCM11491_000053 [Sporobolomyces phaffii]